MASAGGGRLAGHGVIALLCAFAWTPEALPADGADLSAGRLPFQGILPGLDEELVFRGIFAGAGFGWAGAAVTFLFAAGHGRLVVDGGIVANWRPVAITGRSVPGCSGGAPAPARSSRQCSRTTC